MSVSIGKGRSGQTSQVLDATGTLLETCTGQMTVVVG
jgi:hypothetical protein